MLLQVETHQETFQLQVRDRGLPPVHPVPEQDGHPRYHQPSQQTGVLPFLDDGDGSHDPTPMVRRSGSTTPQR